MNKKDFFKYLMIFNKKNTHKLHKINKIINTIDDETDEILMLKSIIAMNETVVRDIMVPRIDAATINIDNCKAEIKKNIAKNVYSRIPVFENKIDNIIGILHIKELIEFIFTKKENAVNRSSILKLLREPYFVPESKKITEVLKEFQLNKNHLAIVIDEYGGFSGIVTMEDIIEQIIGDVQDEFDDETDEFKQIDENTYSIDARATIEDVNEQLDLQIEDTEVDTIGGFIAMLAGKIPKRNEKIIYKDNIFKVSSKLKNSITRVRVELKKSENERKKTAKKDQD